MINETFRIQPYLGKIITRQKISKVTLNLKQLYANANFI